MTDKPQFDGQCVKLGDVATYINGYAFKPADYSLNGKQIIRIQDLTGNAYQTNNFAGELDDKYLVSSGDVLISWSASLGVFEWNKEEAWLNQHIFKVVFNKLPVDKRYFIHQARYVINRGAMLAHGATMRHLTKKVFESLPFSYPNRSEQLTIAKRLDDIQRQIYLAEKQISKLDSLVKSRFIEMFGDLKQGYSCSSCRLGSISRIGSSRRVFRNELLSEGIPFYRGTEIAALSMGSETSPSLFISKERYDELVAITGKPEVGDLLLPSICPDGQIWRVDTGKPFYFKDGRVLWIHPNREIVDSIFLRHALSILFQMSFSDIASGTTFAEMKIFLLKELEVPLPDITVQKKFAAFVAQVDKSRFGGMLHLLNSLSGIMHASFFSVADTD